MKCASLTPSAGTFPCWRGAAQSFAFVLRRKRIRSCGGSLIELLVAVAILCLFATLLTSVVRMVMASSKNAACVSNLRLIGAGMAVYAAENKGFLPPVYWRAQNKTWPVSLMEAGCLAPVTRDQRTALLCPSQPPARWQSDSFSYGMRLPPRNNNEGNSFVYCISANTVRDREGADYGRPSAFFLLGDSVYAGGVMPDKGKQFYYINTSVSDLHVIHLRHAARGNFLFADWHVEALDRKTILDDPSNRVRSSQVYEGDLVAP